jgi:hypothetical protein
MTRVRSRDIIMAERNDIMQQLTLAHGDDAVLLDSERQRLLRKLEALDLELWYWTPSFARPPRPPATAALLEFGMFVIGSLAAAALTFYWLTPALSLSR